MGMIQSIQAGVVRYGGRPVRSEVAHAKGRGDGNPAVRVRNCNPRQGALRGAANGTTGFSYGSLASSTDNAQTTSCRTPRPSRRHNPRASRRPSVSDVSSFVEAVHRTHNERLTRRLMFGTMAGGENPGPDRQEKNWAQCLVDDLSVSRATEGCHGKRPLVVWRRNGSIAHSG